jgi:hypothetical protein
MLEAALLPERIFGLAVVDGRRTVRPGAVVRFRFRARNASEIATPAARLSFVLPPGWSGLEALDAEIPPVRPGGEHVVSFSARPDIADESTAWSTCASPGVRALARPPAPFASNRPPVRGCASRST